MKKKNVVALCLLVGALGTNTQAESLKSAEDKVEAVAKTEMASKQKESFRSHEEDRSIFDTGSTDVVSISGTDQFDVQTELLNCQLQAPFGWLCLTQDFKLQYDTFTYIYEDPMDAAIDMVNSEEHFFLLDYDFENTIEVYFSTDYLGTLVGNAADLDESDDQAVFEIINRNYFQGVEGEIQDFGENHFYHFWKESQDKHYYETYVDGICVDVFVSNLYGEPLQDYVLEDVGVLLAGMGFAS